MELKVVGLPQVALMGVQVASMGVQVALMGVQVALMGVQVGTPVGALVGLTVLVDF